MINDKFLMREPDKMYELQYSSFAIPPSHYSFKCYHHLEMMRESYTFVLYFVVTDTLFYLIPIAISTFSVIRFFQKLQKSIDFQNRIASESGKGGGGGGKGDDSKGSGKTKSGKKRKSLWTLSRIIFFFDTVAFLATLLILICFSLYWLVIDPNAVFLFETVHYLNTFFVIMVSVYFVLRKFGLWAKIFNSVYLSCVSNTDWEMKMAMIFEVPITYNPFSLLRAKL